jgi:hypothetical protein
MFRTQRLEGSAGLAQPGEDALRRRKGERKRGTPAARCHPILLMRIK